MSFSSRLNGGFSLLLSVVLAVQPALMEAAWGQQVIIDPNGNVGTRLQGGTSAPVVDIARPNAGGVSHNRYKRLDTPAGGGVVLNNSASVSMTGLAGQIAGNSNLSGGAGASTIVNEVTSSEQTSLKGRIEVAGTRAHVIVVNPNGLTCDGCSFLNAGEATLSTGVPVVEGAAVRLGVARGSVTIGRGGLDGAASGVGSVNLIGRTVVIDGKVTAIDGVNVQGGAQDYDLTGGRHLRAGTASGPAGSDYAIDGTAFGAMEAGRIQIVGNEQGLGVRLRGAQQANSADVTISGPGKVEVSSAFAQRHVTVRSGHGQVEIDRDLSAATGRVTVTARDTLRLSGRSGLYGETGISLHSTHGEISAQGEMQSGKDITLRGHGLSFGAYAVAADTISFHISDAAGFDGASLIAQKIDGTDFGASVRLAHSAFFAAEDLPVVTRQLHFGRDVVIDGLTEADTSSLIATISGDFRNSGDLRGFDLSRITWGGDLHNETGGILSAEALAISHRGHVHNSGILYGENSITLDLAGLINNETGAVLSQDIRITTTGDLVNRGTIMAENDLRLISGAVLSNAGFIQAAQGWLSAGRLSNLGTGDLRIAGDLHLTATGALRNQGSLNALGTISFAAARIENAGLSIGERAITATGDQITNSGTLVSQTLLRLRGKDITSSGTLASYDLAELTATGSVTNSGALIADKTLSITGPVFANTGADALVRAKTGKIASASLINSGKIFLIDSFERKGDIDLFENNGAFASAGSVQITGRNALSRIVLGQDSHLVAGLRPDDETQVLVTAAALILRAERIEISGQEGRGATIAAGGHITIETPRTLMIGGNVQTRAGNLRLAGSDVTITRGASLHAGGVGTIASRAGLVNAGSLVTGGRLDLAAGFGRLSNSGVLAVGQASTWGLSGALSNTGLISSDVSLRVTAASIHNDGYLQAVTSMNLATAGEARLRGATVAGGAMAITATGLLLDKGLMTPDAGTGKAEANTGLISAAQLRVTAGNFTSRGAISLTGTGSNLWDITNGFRQEGHAHAAGQLVITMASLVTTEATLLSSAGDLLLQGKSGASSPGFDISGNLVGQNVTLRNGGSIRLRAPSMLSSANDITLSSGAGITLAGQVSARAMIEAMADTLAISGQSYATVLKAQAAAGLDHSGTSYAGETLLLGAGGGLTNSGHISSAGEAVLTGAGLFRNETGGKIEATDLELRVNAAGANASLENHGEIFGARTLLIRAEGLNNARGASLRAGKIDLKTTGSLDNNGMIHAFGVFAEIGGGLHNRGTIRGDELVTMVAGGGGIVNVSDGRILARTIVLASGAGLSNSGQIGGAGSTSLPNARSTQLSAAGWLTNGKTIRGEDVALLAAGVTNQEAGSVVATKVLRVQSDTYGVFNHGIMSGADTAVIVKGNFENHNRLAGSATLGIAVETGRLYNNGGLFGPEITLIAEKGALLSETGIAAGSSLLARGASVDLRAGVSAGDRLGLVATTGDLTLAGAATAKTLSVHAARLLKARGGMLRGATRTQIIAGDIQRSDITATNRKLGVVGANPGDLYVELTAGSFGAASATPLTDGPGLAVARYEQASLAASGSVEIVAAQNLFLTGTITAGKAIGLQAKDFAGLRDISLTAGTALHVQGDNHLKNYGNTLLSAKEVTLNQTQGWFYTSDWLPEEMRYDLRVGAQVIVVNSDHRFVNRTVTFRAIHDITQIDSVISAGGIDYVAGNNITIAFDPFDWRAKKITGFLPSYDENPTSASHIAVMKLFFGTTPEDTTLGWQDVSDANKIALNQADTSNWWGTISAGLRGSPLLAQRLGITLTAGQDITLQSGKIHSEGSIDLTAGGRFLSEPVHVENEQGDRPVNVGWSFDSRYGNIDSGHDRSRVQMYELRAYENQIHARDDITISAGTGLDLIGTQLRSANGNITLQSAGGISMLAAPGYWAYSHQHTKTKKKALGLYQKRTTITVDRYRDIYKPTTLIAANGTVSLAATGRLARDADSPDASSPLNAILSAGSAITARNVSVSTHEAGQSILLGTYEETDIDETRTETSRKLLWAVPFGSRDSIRKQRVVTQTGNAMLADEILTLTSSADLTIVGGSYAGQTVAVSAAGDLNIQAAINSIYESNYSRSDNMVIITTINSGKIVESAELPKINSVQPAQFDVGGKVVIAGYHGPALNTLLINAVSSREFDDRVISLYMPKDSDAAESQSAEVSNSYDYQLPYGGDYAYIRTLLNDRGATYETISLRDQSWYDKQVQLNPAFQALLSVAIAAATGNIAGLNPWQKAMLDSTLNSLASGAITGEFDASQALRSALTAGASSFISETLIDRFGLGPPKDDKLKGLTASGVRDKFTPELIRDR
ncbi:MAG: filamentous hemagglutinin N-terminal domain-containing protein, partial [Paracoccus sp. (in: a-proteobacteria)]|nr:filamentous hemagglutinin N-terminal domain-containing protein [Paracoccus sp. (in: a-proteobacteria)]